MTTTIPGLKAKHAIITPACRQRGDDVAIADATARMLVAFWDVAGAPANKDAQFHLVLTVEREPKN